MSELRDKLKRQIEILGICLSQNHDFPLKTFDLADTFSVEELTIKRDLQDLRSDGVDIHSTRKNGVCLSGNLNDEKISEYIHQYAGLCYSEQFIEKSTSLLVKKYKEKALANIVTLQICIEQNKAAKIDYEKETSEIEFGRLVCPLLVFQNDNYWRVLAINEGIIKQYHLNKILEVRETEITFKPVPKENISDIFRYSWRSWLGTEQFKVKLKFSSQWADRFKPKQLIENEELIEEKDGSLIFKITVNSLQEIASWIVGRGEGIIVLEPEELKEKVLELAKGALKNYT